MKNARTFVSAILLTAFSLSMFACGKKETDSKKHLRDLAPEVREKIKSIAENEELLTGDLENKTVKWLSDWDINPDGSGKNVPIDLAVFHHAAQHLELILLLLPNDLAEDTV